MTVALIPQHASAAWKGGARFRHQGSLARFAHVTTRLDRDRAGIAAGHPALAEGRTIFPSTVVSAEESPRLLVSGVNQAKIGARITKGRWRGLPIYCLTLEERATCPRSCAVWAECYGNAMHLARRHAHGPDLEAMLGAELAMLSDLHPGGFAVRLHTLGDFYSVRYVARWSVWLRWLPQLHVFGFTAWGDDTPIGRMVERMNGLHSARCAIRFSRLVPSGQGWEAVTIWREPESHRVAEGLVCPQQRGKTATCGTCALCWAPAMGDTTIVFMGHGKRRRGA